MLRERVRSPDHTTPVGATTERSLIDAAREASRVPLHHSMGDFVGDAWSGNEHRLPRQEKMLLRRKRGRAVRCSGAIWGVAALDLPGHPIQRAVGRSVGRSLALLHGERGGATLAEGGTVRLGRGSGADVPAFGRRLEDASDQALPPIRRRGGLLLFLLELASLDS